MTRPDRNPDFRSGSNPDIEFWFEPEMIAIVQYSSVSTTISWCDCHAPPSTLYSGYK